MWRDSPHGRQGPGGQTVRRLPCTGESPVQLRSGTCQRGSRGLPDYGSPDVTTARMVVGDPPTVNRGGNPVTVRAVRTIKGTLNRRWVSSVGRHPFLRSDTFLARPSRGVLRRFVDGLSPDPVDQVKVRGGPILRRKDRHPVPHGWPGLRLQRLQNQLGRDLAQRPATLLCEVPYLGQRVRGQVQRRPHERQGTGSGWLMYKIRTSAIGFSVRGASLP